VGDGVVSNRLPPPPPRPRPPGGPHPAGEARPDVTDDGLLAEDLDVPVADVKASLDFGNRFDVIVREVLLPLGVVAEYRFDGVPTRSAEIHFVGEVPQAAVAALDEMNVRLRGGASFTLTEQRMLVEQTTKALRVLKPQNALIGLGRDGVTVTVDESEFSQEQLKAVRTSAIELTRAALAAAGNTCALARLSEDSIRFEGVPRSQLPRARRRDVR